MSKKFYAAFLPLLAMTAFTVMPAMAQAAPHWYSCESKTGGKFKDAFCKETASSGTFEWTKIKEDELVKVKAEGRVDLHSRGLAIQCSVKGKETIENPLGGGAGVANVTNLEFTECKSPNNEVCPEPVTYTVLHNGKKLSAANGLPSKLIEREEEPGKKVIRDEIGGAEIEFKCNGILETLLNKGSLTPKIGSSAAEFGSGSGELENMGGEFKLTVTGDVKLEGPAGDLGITAKNP